MAPTAGIAKDGAWAGSLSPARMIRLYVAFQFFFGLLLWIPVFYEAQKRLGLSDPQIFGIQGLYYIVFCVFEVPTGLFADRFGYRASVRWGSLVLIAANALPRLAPDYHGFLWHFVLIALSRSLISGAASAYLYEYLHRSGAGSLYKKAEGDARFWGLAGKVVCWSGVGYLMAVNTLLVYDLSALNGLLALILSFFWPVMDRVPRALEGKRPVHALMGGHVGEALRLGLMNPLVRCVILQGVGIFVTVRILQVNLFQPILSERHFSVERFGAVMALMTVFEALGSRWAPRAIRWFSDRQAVTVMTVMIAVAMGGIAVSGQVGTVVGLSLFSLAAGMAFPIQRQVLNDAITESRFRATLLSLESIVDRAVCALAVWPLGGLVAKGFLNMTLLYAALAVLAAALSVQWGINRLTATAVSAKNTVDGYAK